MLEFYWIKSKDINGWTADICDDAWTVIRQYLPRPDALTVSSTSRNLRALCFAENSNFDKIFARIAENEIYKFVCDVSLRENMPNFQLVKESHKRIKRKIKSMPGLGRKMMSKNFAETTPLQSRNRPDSLTTHVHQYLDEADSRSYHHSAFFALDDKIHDRKLINNLSDPELYRFFGEICILIDKNQHRIAPLLEKHFRKISKKRNREDFLLSKYLCCICCPKCHCKVPCLVNTATAAPCMVTNALALVTCFGAGCFSFGRLMNGIIDGESSNTAIGGVALGTSCVCTALGLCCGCCGAMLSQHATMRGRNTYRDWIVDFVTAFFYIVKTKRIQLSLDSSSNSDISSSGRSSSSSSGSSEEREIWSDSDSDF